MKALILCGGLGSRLWPITLSLPKQLIPICNKPILFYILDSLVDADINEIGIIVNNNESIFKEALSKYTNRNIDITFINQSKPLGIADAVLKAENFIAGDKFVTILGDNFYDDEIKNLIDGFFNKSMNAKLLLQEVKCPQQFGVAEIERDKLINLVEKPINPPTNLAITGLYLFDKSIFNACKEIEPSWRGEFEITDAIKWLLDNGYNIGYRIIKNGWKDLGKPEDILEANSNELMYIKRSIRGNIDDRTKVKGNIELGENSKIINSVIEGPISIGKNTIIINSNIGPYTSVSNDVYINNSSIGKSIILDRCQIKNITYGINESIIDTDSILEKVSSKDKKFRVLLGRKSKIIINDEWINKGS